MLRVVCQRSVRWCSAKANGAGVFVGANGVGVHAAPGVSISASDIGGTTFPLILGPGLTEPEVGLFFQSQASSEGVHPIPTTRFKSSKEVMHVTVRDGADPQMVQDVISTEAEDDSKFTTSTPPVPGTFIVSASAPDRLCGIVLSDGSILSAKDPVFIINWVAHVLPCLVSKDTTRFPQAILQYINDTKRVIMKSSGSIPSMDLCQNIFVKNSIEDFKYFML
eukprot:TRINITY_DN1935_c3_g1_i1.p1 TRINITY_DN1935_c3_g1~~TRINITY_DN1935_c3_g1_i1.p1  ORF type:complete len:222 (+),score=35.82 TRINITY_DN1935_c3_g1_i1:43-708(+)